MSTPNEASEADVQEQRQPVREEPPPVAAGFPDDAPEADVAEQRMEVDLGDEDTPIG